MTFVTFVTCDSSSIVSAPHFHGLSVLVLESRRRNEMASLVSTYGGRPVAAPALREVPIDSNTEALAFAEALQRDGFDLVILLTGVGTRALLDVVQATGSRDEFVAALARTKVVPRGPKPMAVLRELKIVPWITVPEPNTWRELLDAIDAASANGSLRGMRVAVQEYGVSNAGSRRGPRSARRAALRGCLCIAGLCPKISNRFVRLSPASFAANWTWPSSPRASRSST